MSGQASLDAIFYTALDLDTDEARAAYLDRICGEDTPLRRRVEQLLHAHAKAGSFLRLPDTESSTTVDPPTLSEEAGTRIGPYRLMQQIGEGGMGVVWWAEQEQPVRRQVALKIIRPGIDSRQIIARFEIERQALALMDHVNIARVLDAGTTENGRPFFVMELIHGIPITQYCDDKQLTVRERLKLFVPVCQAIQHAHQKGIIHRDIKPSNVLVAEHEGRAVPKVIDFGVAKAMGQRLTEGTVFTHFGTILGTFEYMSPEQADNSAQGIDTRSDIYSLGVLLYQLLTGTTPLESQRLRTASFSEIVRLIVEEEPPKPSTRLGQSGTLPPPTAARKVESLRLAKMVRGELDWIVMKALEKDRNRRYETANDLARDIQRYLADEPVEACPPSGWYRLGKLARRHKQALAAAAGVLLALTVLACTIGYFLHERQTSRIEAETEQRHAIETALEKASGLRQKGHRAEARLALEQAREYLGDTGPADLRRLVDQAIADLTLVERLESIRLNRVATNVDGLVAYPTAERDYAAAWREACLGEEGDDAEGVSERIRGKTEREQLVAALDDWAAATSKPESLAWLLEVARRADPDPWRDRFRDPKVWRDRAALEALASELLRDPTQLAQQNPQLLVALGQALRRTQADAVPLLKAAQPWHPDDFWLNFLLAFDLGLVKQWDEAIRYYQAALALRPELPSAHLNLGFALLRKKRLEEAMKEFRTTIALDPKNALAHLDLGTVFLHKKQLDEAISEFRIAIDLDPKYAGAHTNLGNALFKKNQVDEAIGELRTAIRLNPNYAPAHLNLGITLYFKNQVEESINEFRTAIRLDAKDPAAHYGLGYVLHSKKQLDDAIHEFRTAIALDPDHFEAHYSLGVALHAKKQFDQSIGELRTAIGLNARYAPAHFSLGVSLAATRDVDGAIACWRKALHLDPKHVEAHFSLGVVLHARKQLDEAIREYRACLAHDPKHNKAHNMLCLVLTAKGLAAAHAGQWDKAAAAFLETLELDPPRDHLGWFLSAPLLLQTGDLPGYRRACREMLTRFGKSNAVEVVERTAKTCLLAPDSVTDFALVLRLADLAVQKSGSDRWIQLTKALAEYRGGRYASATEWLQRVNPRASGDSLDAAALALLAMSRKQQGQTEAARTALSQARALLDHKLPEFDKGQRFGDDWHDWLRSQILCREAESLLATEGKNTAHKDTTEPQKKP
jgi:tetratricopeptide (TPR) repeat protein/serine/threonine protein kinase